MKRSSGCWLFAVVLLLPGLAAAQQPEELGDGGGWFSEQPEAYPDPLTIPSPSIYSTFHLNVQWLDVGLRSNTNIHAGGSLAVIPDTLSISADFVYTIPSSGGSHVGGFGLGLRYAFLRGPWYVAVAGIHVGLLAHPLAGDFGVDIIVYNPEITAAFAFGRLTLQPGLGFRWYQYRIGGVDDVAVIDYAAAASLHLGGGFFVTVEPGGEMHLKPSFRHYAFVTPGVSYRSGRFSGGLGARFNLNHQDERGTYTLVFRAGFVF